MNWLDNWWRFDIRKKLLLCATSCWVKPDFSCLRAKQAMRDKIKLLILHKLKSKLSILTPYASETILNHGPSK